MYIPIYMYISEYMYIPILYITAIRLVVINPMACEKFQ